MDIDCLLTEQPLDPDICVEEFRQDVDSLLEVLRECYGGYDCFSAERFQEARDAVLRDVERDFCFHRAVESLKARFYAVVKDGHFTIGPTEPKANPYDYAVRFDTWNGIPVIDCKRFWYENDAGKAELEAFVERAAQYRSDEPLILDLRDNPGGSDIYIYEFLRGLFGMEPSYPCRFIQRNSPLFLAYLARVGIEPRSDENPQIKEDHGLTIQSGKPIYVLINENTCSSGESAIAYLKTVTSVVLVGDHSGGAFSFGNCVQVWLPNSHLPVYFGTGMVLYEKTRNIDAEGGFRADISIEEFFALFS